MPLASALPSPGFMSRATARLLPGAWTLASLLATVSAGGRARGGHERSRCLGHLGMTDICRKPSVWSFLINVRCANRLSARQFVCIGNVLTGHERTVAARQVASVARMD